MKRRPDSGARAPGRGAILGKPRNPFKAKLPRPPKREGPTPVALVPIPKHVLRKRRQLAQCEAERAKHGWIVGRP